MQIDTNVLNDTRTCITAEEVGEDFSNALDVLRCLLRCEHHPIINELDRLYKLTVELH